MDGTWHLVIEYHHKVTALFPPLEASDKETAMKEGKRRWEALKAYDPRTYDPQVCDPNSLIRVNASVAYLIPID